MSKVANVSQPIANGADCGCVNNGAYKDFFKGKLEKYKISSPKELSDDDKSKFFDEVDRDWKSKTEKVNTFNMFGTCPKCGCAISECECEK
jgi:hypothetical protein